jgi:hypothetical protein
MNCAELLFVSVAAPARQARPLSGLTRPAALATALLGTHSRNASVACTTGQMPTLRFTAHVIPVISSLALANILRCEQPICASAHALSGSLMIMSPHPIGFLPAFRSGENPAGCQATGVNRNRCEIFLTPTLEDSGVGVESKSVERPSQTWSLKFAVNSINGMIVTR